MTSSVRPHHHHAPAADDPVVAAATVRTLIVDDEPLARLRLRTLLADHRDFAVVGECGDGREVLDAIARTRPDLLFLDVQMAEVNGLEVARALEQATTTSSAPPPAIVFVTAFDQYAVRAFEVRALDYLLKPFDEERFAATLVRVRAHRASGQAREAHARLLGVLRDLSRGNGDHAGAEAAARAAAAAAAAPRPESTTLRVADMEVDVRARVVRRAGTPVQLRPKEFDLLVALIRRAGDVVPRRELLHDVWGYSDDVVSRTIDTHLAELRRKLGHRVGDPGHISTIARTGYRLEL
ncbi:MAG TPA: response regulator [Gemmatimonadaceae bacterium]|nr:response regulator [Gemmatimonadaceae bacterium]